MKKRATKKAISMALAATMAFAPVQAFAASSDITGHWAESAITSWQDKGLISGYEDGTFKPDNSITRAEFATMVNKALGLTEKGEVPFSDVQSGSWYYDAISIAVKAGYCSGYEDGTFKPNATITRAEAAVMISLAKGLVKDDIAAAKFADYANIPAWAKGYVGAVVGAGYMSGRPDGTFDATNTITRAEAVSSLDRAMTATPEKEEEKQEEESKDVTVTEDDTVIEDKTIEGNLIIDKAVGDGEVYVKNTTVKGDIIVQGGGDDSVYLTDVVTNGKVSVEKENVRVQFKGKTEVANVEVKAVCQLQGRDFEGTIGTIAILADLGTNQTVKVDVPAEAVDISAKASVAINADVETVTVAEDAKDSKVEVSTSATIGTVVADGKVAISGSGKVEKLEANVSGITVSGSTTVTNTTVAAGVDKPTAPSTSTGGGGGSSSSSSSGSSSATVKGVYITAPETVKPNSTKELFVVVEGTGSYNKNVTWSVTGGTTSETKIDTQGVLTVGAEKDDTVLEVTATSVGDKTKKDTVKITVKSEEVTTGLVELKISDVIKANIDDRASEDDPFTSNGISIDSIDKTKVNTVKVLTKDLKEHKNGDDPSTMGYWTGFAVKAPEGATHMKYISGVATEGELIKDSLSKLTENEQAVDGKNATGIGFYANVTAKPDEYKDVYYAVQFFNAKDEAVTDMYKFKMDLSEVTIAGADDEEGTTQYVSAENPAEVKATVGTELSGTSATITVTNATAVTNSGITVTPSEATNGITAAVGDVSGNTVTINLTGKPDARASLALQTFKVTIPKKAITGVDEGYTAKELEVTVTVNVAKAEITGFTPIAKETIDSDKKLFTAKEAAAELPSSVTLTTADGTVEATITSWTCETYDPNKIDTAQTFTAEFTMPEGYEDKQSPITVTAEIKLDVAQTNADA